MTSKQDLLCVFRLCIVFPLAGLQLLSSLLDQIKATAREY